MGSSKTWAAIADSRVLRGATDQQQPTGDDTVREYGVQPVSEPAEQTLDRGAGEVGSSRGCESEAEQ
jgi:hypothetical protein